MNGRFAPGWMVGCLFVNWIASGCAAAEPTRLEGNVLILAAASTTDAVEEMRRRFVAVHPGVLVRTSFGASSALAQQVEAGAEADLFLSASQEWAERLAEAKLVAKQRELVGNRLVVIVPADSKLTLGEPADLVKVDVQRLAIADPQSVPAGVYARQSLEKLQLWDQLAPRLAIAADVRQAAQFVATGAAEVGIVYASDATADPRVRVTCTIDPKLSTPIRYPLLLLKHAESNPAAQAFYEYLASAEAAAVFERHGFVALKTTAAKGAENRPGPAAVPPAKGEVSWWRLSREEWLALSLSFRVGFCAVLASLPFATAVGYYLARATWRGKWLVDLVVNLPLVMPPVVTGYLLLILFSPRGPLGAGLESWLGIRIVFTWLGAALAAAVVSFPLMVRAIRLAFEGVDPRLEMAARSLGAKRWDAFWSVSLPLARRGLLAGCVLAFARGLGEFGATIMVAGNIVGETQTIPLAIFSDANRPGAEVEVWRMVCISIVLAAAALAASEWLERRHAARESA